MAHYRILIIGTLDDLDYIFENETSDSSSESTTEQAFGYDYIDTEWGEKEYGYKNYFYKNSNIYKKLYDIMSSFLWDCEHDTGIDILDLRDRDNWTYVNFNCHSKTYRTKKEIFDILDNLPTNTKFMACDVHL